MTSLPQLVYEARSPEKSALNPASTLLTLAAADRALASRLAADGSLFQGYHPEMEALHRANAAQLREIVTAHGWPGRSLVGEEAAEAAWLIVQHAIGEPVFQREMLAVLQVEAQKGEVPAWQVAKLEDRVRSFEGRPQRYGTQFDWDEAGQMSPWPEIEEPEAVDERRAAVGLPPLAEAIASHCARAAASGALVPADLAARRREMDEWSLRVGWRG
ncbi:MAG TPA: DUF6624 domain-containing protein [Thermoanaerobaculia bacterium]|nr:DUF6624 domain-containing protein [Thermoanaerobaculia bacterium]